MYFAWRDYSRPRRIEHSAPRIVAKSCWIVVLSFVELQQGRGNVAGTRMKKTPKTAKRYFWLARWRCLPRTYASDRNLQQTNNDDTISPIQSVFFQNLILN